MTYQFFNQLALSIPGILLIRVSITVMWLVKNRSYSELGCVYFLFLIFPSSIGIDAFPCTHKYHFSQLLPPCSHHHLHSLHPHNSKFIARKLFQLIRGKVRKLTLLSTEIITNHHEKFHFCSARKGRRPNTRFFQLLTWTS